MYRSILNVFAMGKCFAEPTNVPPCYETHIRLILVLYTLCAFARDSRCRKSVGQALLNPFVQVGDFIDDAHFAELAKLRSAADARVFRQRLRTDGQTLFDAVFRRLSAR